MLSVLASLSCRLAGLQPYCYCFTICTCTCIIAHILCGHGWLWWLSPPSVCVCVCVCGRGWLWWLSVYRCLASLPLTALHSNTLWWPHPPPTRGCVHNTHYIGHCRHMYLHIHCRDVMVCEGVCGNVSVPGETSRSWHNQLKCVYTGSQLLTTMFDLSWAGYILNHLKL